jgi:hypothetical protein
VADEISSTKVEDKAYGWYRGGDLVGRLRFSEFLIVGEGGDNVLTPTKRCQDEKDTDGLHCIESRVPISVDSMEYLPFVCKRFQSLRYVTLRSAEHSEGLSLATCFCL